MWYTIGTTYVCLLPFALYCTLMNPTLYMRVHVSVRCRQLRGSIRSLLVARRQAGGGGTGTTRRPHATTKQGRLKTGRKSKLAPMFVDDLASLERLTEEVIVTQLQQRYRAGQIYTYIGDILIAVNPFSDVNIYGEKVGGWV